MTGRTAVAVLGAGILGTSTALLLARQGAQVTLVDAAPEPFCGASRWNEGKIHLGFLYAADRSLATARRLLLGGLAFRGVVEQLIGESILPATTSEDDVYLLHRDSVVGVEETGAYASAVADLVSSHPEAAGYLVDARRAHVTRLAAGEVDGLACSDRIVAGLRVPERSVSTNWLADAFVSAVRAENRIDPAMEHRVLSAVPSASGPGGPWTVLTDRGTLGPFDWVVNCLWQGRLAVDAPLGLTPPGPWTHRYRLSIFVTTEVDVPAPSAVIATGPFGDIKNYGGRSFYLSWYPAGLVATGSGIHPPDLPAIDSDFRQRVASTTMTELARYVRSVPAVHQAASALRVEGGWVYAVGDGALSDPAATLHRRDRFGIRRHGTYVTVDTAKYSIAPWLALRIAAIVSDGART